MGGMRDGPHVVDEGTYERKPHGSRWVLAEASVWAESPARGSVVPRRLTAQTPGDGMEANGVDTFWWLALGLVMLLAFVAALVDGRGRLGPGGRGAARAARAVGRDGVPAPRPGEIWRTALPDGTDALFLVLAVRSDGVRLAPLTRSPSPVTVLPAGAGSGPVYLEPGPVAEAGLARLRERCGEVDAATWERVRHLAG